MTNVSHKDALTRFRWPENNVGPYGLASDITHETIGSVKQFQQFYISKTCFLIKGIHWLSCIYLPQAEHNCYFTPEPMSQRLMVWMHMNIKQQHAALCPNYYHPELWLNYVYILYSDAPPLVTNGRKCYAILKE